MLLDALPALAHAAGLLLPALLLGVAVGAGLAALTAPRPDPALAEAIGTLPLSRRQRLRHVRLPAALPRMFTGARLGAVAALLVVLAVEAARSGDAASLAVLLLLGSATVLVVRRMERRVLAWR
jgi:ABC-type nitrate/sulfonate/bicarbonate transport system permease component